ncbi:SPOR domain-containing protein [Haloimpatiens sp. FM7315]|uniref:SPOR domain-containing protein n=1 Tax=Haloimpatiens sp. FM7315 TaxID=3298609 RepID=UPI00370A4722
MNYIRYNVKKKRKINILVVIIFIIVAAILVIYGKNKNMEQKATDFNIEKVNPVNQNNVKKNNIKKYYCIQCGVFSTTKNAEAVRDSLKSYGTPFIVEKESKFKVILGIYNEEEYKAISKKLNSSEIQNVKVTYEIPEDNLCSKEIAEIFNANLKVLNKFIDPKVKAVKTENLKKWVNSLEEVKKEEKNFKILSSMKEYVKKYPGELNRENLEEYCKFMYKCIDSVN